MSPWLRRVGGGRSAVAAAECLGHTAQRAAHTRRFEDKFMRRHILHSHPVVHAITLFSFFSFSVSPSVLTHCPLWVFCVCVWKRERQREATQGNCSVSTATWPAKQYRKVLYLFFLSTRSAISSFEKREGRLTVTYHCAQVCEARSSELVHPCWFPRPVSQVETPPPTSLPPPPYYYGTMWTMAFNLLFSPSLLLCRYLLKLLRWIFLLPLRAPVLVALALIESGMKYEDAVQFIRQWVPFLHLLCLLCLKRLSTKY